MERWSDEKMKAEIRKMLANSTDADLIPHYKTIYTPESVELEDTEILLNNKSIDEPTCLKILSNSCKQLKADFNNYLIDSYKTLEYNDERLSYIDIANISRFIIWKFKSNDTECFEKIFNSADMILKHSDEEIKNLIIVGLFEGIQNIGGWHKIDYQTAFDKWLGEESKKAWQGLIKFWGN